MKSTQNTIKIDLSLVFKQDTCIFFATKTHRNTNNKWSCHNIIYDYWCAKEKPTEEKSQLGFNCRE